MLMRDKIVIVSGIGPGLGQELAVLAAQEGAAGLSIGARTPYKLDDTENKIRSLGIDIPILKIKTDITDRKQCEHFASETISNFNRIDVLFNSAYDPGEFEFADQADLGNWRRVMDTNFFGSLELTQSCIPYMQTQNNGTIVMIATMAEHKPMLMNGGYAASKSALRSATKQLAMELGNSNIRLNSAHIGWMWGPAVEGYFKNQSIDTGIPIENLKKIITDDIPIGRIPEDEECAKAAMILASDYASAVTGASLDINGGMFMPI